MPMKYLDGEILNHNQFIQYHNAFKEQLKEDRIESIIINVVGWGDEPQMCDAKLCVSYKRPDNYDELDQDQQYVIWDRNFEHEKDMIEKWQHYTNIASNYLIHYHSQCNGADYGGRAELIFHVQTLELDQVVYGHEYTYSKEMPQRDLIKS